MGKNTSGEVKKPKSFSLRTLELLKNLSKEEAEIFTKFANLRINSGDKNFVFNNDNEKLINEKFKISFADRLLLTELGLMSTENNLQLQVKSSTTVSSSTYYYAGKAILINRNGNTPEKTFHVLAFTKVGAELAKLIEPSADVEYIEKFCDSFVHENTSIKYGDVVKLPNDKLILTNVIEYKQNK